MQYNRYSPVTCAREDYSIGNIKRKLELTVQRNRKLKNDNEQFMRADEMRGSEGGGGGQKIAFSNE